MNPSEVRQACVCGNPLCTRPNNIAFRVGMLITVSRRMAVAIIDKKATEAKLTRSSDVQITRPRGVRGGSTGLRMSDLHIATPVTVEELDKRIAERRERDREAYRRLYELPPFELGHPVTDRA